MGGMVLSQGGQAKRRRGRMEQVKRNASGGAIAGAPIAVWLSQEYGVPLEVVSPLLVWVGVWLRGLIND
jgi:hypothetical protein